METKLKDYMARLMANESKVCRVQWDAHSHVEQRMIMDQQEGYKVSPAMENKIYRPLVRAEIPASLLRGTLVRCVRRVRRAAK